MSDANAPSADDLKDLCKKVNSDIDGMSQWWERQRTWYNMRHNGLRRKNQPFPNCADLHFPLADSIIEKLKPFYFNQLFGTDTVASFVATESDFNDVATSAAQWFDYRLKQKSNLETEVLIAIDQMLMAGMEVIKVGWKGGDKKQVSFTAFDPSRVIVPQWTKDIQEADRVTFVMTTSAEQYERDDRWTDHSKEFVDSIKGKGNSQDGTNTSLDQSKVIREGFSQTENKEEIVYWEIWEHRAAGWCVHWVSPNNSEKVLRPSMQNPFTHKLGPFVRFDVEIKAAGHYQSRGIPERVGAFEAGATKNWNEKTDYQTFCNQPLFTAPPGVPNPGNMRFLPGSFVGNGIAAVQMPAPPVSFDDEIRMQRATAEELIGMPDFGIGSEQDSSAPRTATEVQKISQLTTVGVDMRARTFRRSLGEMYQLAWATLLQFDTSLQYLVGDEMKGLSQDQLTQLQANPECVVVLPNGSGDSWNRQAGYQRAVQRKALFAQSPWINQPELDKTILELDDPRLVKRLFQDPNQKGMDEYQDESTMIPAMLLGLQLQPEPGQDYAMRIKADSDFLNMQAMKGVPPNPHGIMTVTQRMTALMQALQQTNPKQAAEVAKAVQMASQHTHVTGKPPGMNGQPPAPPMPPQGEPSLNGNRLPAMP